MATRARIGVQLADDSILSVYHHYDGYPEWLGKQLEEHYNSYELASELIDGGDMSVCWTNERWDAQPNEFGGTTRSEVEEYGPNYYSYRGEKCEPRLDETLGAYANKQHGEEYHYFWSQKYDMWVCIDMHQFCESEKDPQVVSIPR